MHSEFLCNDSFSIKRSDKCDEDRSYSIFMRQFIYTSRVNPM